MKAIPVNSQYHFRKINESTIITRIAINRESYQMYREKYRIETALMMSTPNMYVVSSSFWSVILVVSL